LSHQEKGPLQLLYERLYVVVVATAVAVTVAWFVAGRLDPVYRAQARCYMPTNPDVLSLSSEAENLPRAPKLPTGSIEIQDSLLGVLRGAELRQAVAAEIEGRDSAQLEKNVAFELDRYNLLTISVYDGDPAVAQRIAEAYLRLFRDQLDQSTKADIRKKADLFDQRATETRAEIDRLQRERIEFLAGRGTVDFQSEFQMAAGRVSAYRQKVDELDARAVALQTGMSELLRQLGELPDPGDPEKFVQRSLAEIANPRLEQLKGQIRTAELELVQLRQRFEDGARQILDKQAEIAALTGLLAEEIERIAGSIEYGPDPLAQDLEKKLHDQQVQIAATAAEREVYARLFEEAQAEYAKMPEYELMLSDYDAQLAQLRQTLTDTRSRLSEALLYLGRTTSFLETAEAPSLPTKPWFPNMPVILAAAALLGLVLSLTAALGMARAALFRQEALW
jgi:uncharacterized protein involved in exopolysaccharide biosynthesis